MKLTMFECVLFLNLCLKEQVKQAKKGESFLVEKLDSLSEKLKKEELLLRNNPEQQDDESEDDNDEDSLEDDELTEPFKIDLVFGMARYTKNVVDTFEEIERLYPDLNFIPEGDFSFASKEIRVCYWFAQKMLEGSKRAMFLKALSIPIT